MCLSLPTFPRLSPPAGSSQTRPGRQRASPTTRSHSPSRWPSPVPGDPDSQTIDAASVRDALRDLMQKLQEAQQERVKRDSDLLHPHGHMPPETLGGREELSHSLKTAVHLSVHSWAC